MTAPYIPDPEWHKQKSPEEWQAIQTAALRDHRANIHDQEAMNAIRDSNEALNMYEQPAITAGEHTLASGWGDPVEGLKGELEGAAGAITAPFSLANTAYRSGAGTMVDELINGITSIPKDIASGDPRRIGRVAGGVAGSIALGKGVGMAGKRVGGTLSEWADRPGLKNTLLKSQIAKTNTTINQSPLTTALLEGKKALLDQSLEQKAALHPDILEQAGLKTNQMHQNVAEKAGTLHDNVEQAHLKTSKLKQDVSRGAGSLDATTKRPGLQNELTELQIERLKRLLDDMNNDDENGGSGAVPPKPPNDVLGPGGNKVHDPNFRDDPYGVNDLRNTKAPPGMKDNIMDKLTPPNDELGNFIGKLRGEAEAPHDILGPEDMGTKPITPDELNRILGDILKKPPNNGPNK